MTVFAALVPDKKPTPPTAVSGTEDKHADKCFCEDDKSNKATKLKELEVTSQIHFEDSLHNLIYIKRYVTYVYHVVPCPFLTAKA